MRDRLRRECCGAAIAALFGALVLFQAHGAAQAPAAAVDARDLSGYWELSYDSMNVPPASLARSVTPKMLQAAAERDAHAMRWCHIIGLPAAMSAPRPIEIAMHQRAVWILFEVNAVNRQIALDRSQHVNQDEFDFTTRGDSIGRWDGDTLVVDTIGFIDERGITSIPGGGYRTSKSHLVERFRLMKNGTVLSAVSTWTDPTMFRTPHSYEVRYDRLPSTYEPRPAAPCDAFDQDRIKFVTAGRMFGPTSAPAIAK